MPGCDGDGIEWIGVVHVSYLWICACEAGTETIVGHFYSDF